MRSTIHGVCDRVQKDEYLSSFFKKDLDKLQEVWNHMDFIWNESILNAMFLKRHQIDMASLMEINGVNVRKDAIKRRNLEKKYDKDKKVFEFISRLLYHSI